MSDITPYDIAHVIGVLLDRTQTNEGGVIGADVLDEVLRIDLTLRDGDKVHFRAVVVEGEEGPIVLERPDITDPSAVTGPRFGEEVGESLDNGWSVFATNHVLFGGTGHISPAEARRFAAALVATADALEAAQAQTGGDQ